MRKILAKPEPPSMRTLFASALDEDSSGKMLTGSSKTVKGLKIPLKRMQAAVLFPSPIPGKKTLNAGQCCGQAIQAIHKFHGDQSNVFMDFRTVSQTPRVLAYCELKELPEHETPDHFDNLSILANSLLDLAKGDPELEDTLDVKQAYAFIKYENISCIQASRVKETAYSDLNLGAPSFKDFNSVSHLRHHVTKFRRQLMQILSS